MDGFSSLTTKKENANTLIYRKMKMKRKNKNKMREEESNWKKKTFASIAFTICASGGPLIKSNIIATKFDCIYTFLLSAQKSIYSAVSLYFLKHCNSKWIERRESSYLRVSIYCYIGAFIAFFFFFCDQ